MSRTKKRVPGWVVVLLMAVFIAGMGLAIWLAVRPDPTLPRAPIERR